MTVKEWMGAQFQRLAVPLGKTMVSAQLSRRQPREPVVHPRDVEPGLEETGGLGTLTGCDDNEHSRSLPSMSAWRRC